MKKTMKDLISCACLLFLLVSPSDSFDFPSLENIKDLFNSLGNAEKETKTSKAKAPKRLKRQSTDIGDESVIPWEVRSSSLPLMPDKKTPNARYMPTLGNGNLAVTVYDDVMYLNGLYNGEGVNSHRAAIPAILMTRLNLTTPEYERRATRKFTYNARDGFFLESINCDFAVIEHRTYIHQKYIRLFVTDIYVRQQAGSIGGGTLTLERRGLSSADTKLGDRTPYLGNWEIRGTTTSSEKGQANQPFFIFYQEPVNQISVSGSNWEANYTFIMSVDKQESNARTEFDQAMKVLQQPRENSPNWNFFMEHVNAWRQTWANGRVELSGSDSQVIKAAWFAQSYILNSLPAENAFLPPIFTEVFYGCGRTSMAKGALGKDYQGHIMWDNEMYIMPAILPFHPGLAKQQLRYRRAMYDSAVQNAKQFGVDGNPGVGCHFPWESASSGFDVSSDPCLRNDTLCNLRKIYVTAGVSNAIRQYYSMTRDRDYMISPYYRGCDISRDIAKFLANLAVYNPVRARYDINDITGPDESHPRVSNHAYTLASVSLAIHWARYFSCLCQRNERDEVPDEYLQKALYLDMPYDNVKRLHYEYKGFNPDTDGLIKQADTIMLNYPLNWNYSVDIMRNDLNLYELLQDKRPPALTWSWFTIGWKWTNEWQKMRAYFLKSYQDYMIQPFKIWTEYNERSQADQDGGSVNFLPGMGGFLQSLIYGFGGVRIRPDRLEIHQPMPPPGINKMTFYNFQYLQNNLTFVIEENKVTIICNATSPNNQYPLILRVNETSATEQSINKDSKIVITPSTSGFFIYTSVAETCEHPRDYIYMPWGYTAWFQGAPVHFDLDQFSIPNSEFSTSSRSSTSIGQSVHCSMRRLTLLFSLLLITY